MKIFERISNWLKFFNQIALSVIVGTVAIAIVWMLGFEVWRSFSHHKWGDEVDVKAPVVTKEGGKSEISLKVGEIHKVGDLWVADIEEPKDSYSRNLVYTSSNHVTRNAVLSSVKSDKVRLLFNSYENKLNSLHSLPEEGIAKVIVCKYVKNYKDDTNDEKTSVMLLNLDGTKQKSIIENVDRVFKIELAENDDLHIIYFKDGKLINARFSVSNFNEIAKPTVFDLKQINLQDNQLLGAQ